MKIKAEGKAELIMEDWIIYIPVIGGIITFIICIKKLVLSGRSPKQKELERSKAEGCVARGTLLDQWVTRGYSESSSIEGRYRSRHAIYEYYVDGKRYTAAFSAKLPPGSRFYSYPETRQIYYKKGKPKKIITEGEASEAGRMERGCLLTFLYTILVIFIIGRIIVAVGWY